MLAIRECSNKKYMLCMDPRGPDAVTLQVTCMYSQCCTRVVLYLKFGKILVIDNW